MVFFELYMQNSSFNTKKVKHHASFTQTAVEVIVKSHYEQVIIVITRVQGRAEDECNNNDNLRV